MNFKVNDKSMKKYSKAWTILDQQSKTIANVSTMFNEANNLWEQSLTLLYKSLKTTTNR